MTRPQIYKDDSIIIVNLLLNIYYKNKIKQKLSIFIILICIFFFENNELSWRLNNNKLTKF